MAAPRISSERSPSTVSVPSTFHHRMVLHLAPRSLGLKSVSVGVIAAGTATGVAAEISSRFNCSFLTEALSFPLGSHGSYAPAFQEITRHTNRLVHGQDVTLGMVCRLPSVDKLHPTAQRFVSDEVVELIFARDKQYRGAAGVETK